MRLQKDLKVRENKMFVRVSSARGILLCLLLTAVLLYGCGNNPSEAVEPPDHSETEISEQIVIGDSPEKETLEEVKENAGINKIIYEGRYFDEKWYNYVDMPAEESPLIYCEIIISNVTDTSFDFAINEEVMATGESTPVIPAGTATIEDAGARAVYKGDDMTLTFLFPDDQNTFPQHLEISGLEKLENNVYMNNSIPGHESG